MTQSIIDLLEKGAKANRNDPWRRGNLICPPDKGTLVVAGDIHGHRRNFERIIEFADLEKNSDTHLVLQEIIHGGLQDAEGGCLSYRLLFDVVRYKLRFSDRVHIIMGNHDTAFISNSEVMKNGIEMNRSMSLALEREFGQNGTGILTAIRQFLFSQPLAVRCNNKIWMSHSLPADRNVEDFDPGIMEKQLAVEDLTRPGSAYLLTWGRNFSQSLLEKMAELFDVECFILGHQPQEQGFAREAENLMIIASDHNHGCLLAFDMARSYNIDELIDSIVPLASIA